MSNGLVDYGKRKRVGEDIAEAALAARDRVVARARRTDDLAAQAMVQRLTIADAIAEKRSVDKMGSDRTKTKRLHRSAL